MPSSCLYHEAIHFVCQYQFYGIGIPFGWGYYTDAGCGYYDGWGYWHPAPCYADNNYYYGR